MMERQRLASFTIIWMSSDSESPSRCALRSMCEYRRMVESGLLIS